MRFGFTAHPGFKSPSLRLPNSGSPVDIHRGAAVLLRSPRVRGCRAGKCPSRPRPRPVSAAAQRQGTWSPKSASCGTRSGQRARAIRRVRPAPRRARSTRGRPMEARPGGHQVSGTRRPRRSHADGRDRSRRCGRRAPAPRSRRCRHRGGPESSAEPSAVRTPPSIAPDPRRNPGDPSPGSGRGCRAPATTAGLPFPGGHRAPATTAGLPFPGGHRAPATTAGLPFPGGHRAPATTAGLPFLPVGTARPRRQRGSRSPVGTARPRRQRGSRSLVGTARPRRAQAWPQSGTGMRPPGGSLPNTGLSGSSGYGGCAGGTALQPGAATPRHRCGSPRAGVPPRGPPQWLTFSRPSCASRDPGPAGEPEQALTHPHIGIRSVAMARTCARTARTGGSLWPG